MQSPTPKKPTRAGGGDSGSSRENVKVVCRVRPSNNREALEGGVTCVRLGPDSVEVETKEAGPGSYQFDRVFGMDSTQQQVFDYAAVPLISDVLAGYNATIFAYGQTGKFNYSTITTS